MRVTIRHAGALGLALFGLLTLLLSTSLIFDWFSIRERQGNYVPVIVWANLICSILYLFCAVGLLKMKSWTVKLLGLALAILLAAFIGLYFHIDAGGAFERKTIGAMIFRIVVTLTFMGLAHFTIGNVAARPATETD